ncbi:MAG: hypothetical protein JNM40_16810 [Myxococcales bacterium]|nr:hypothetical protein [Myxococcales bacterium]
MKNLFLAWQDPRSHAWFPIGRLSVEHSSYRFVYIQGAEDARQKSGFQPLEAFPSFDQIYESEELFALFANRLPPASRTDYTNFVDYLNLSPSEKDPIVLLGRSSGERMTDTMQVFPEPEKSADGFYVTRFFANGINHLPESSLQRIEQLKAGERLRLMKDIQNTYEGSALLLRTNAEVDGDLHIVGYCPRYLLDDAVTIIDQCSDVATMIRIEVERINLPPAPKKFRVLCKMSARWPNGFQPFTSSKYLPINR